MVINKSNKYGLSPENCAIVGGIVWQCSSTTPRAHTIIIVFYFQVWKSFLSRDLLYISFFLSFSWFIHSLPHPFIAPCIHFAPLLCTTLWMFWASLVAQRLKRLPGMQEAQVQPLGWEDPLGKEMATYSSTLAWRIPWREEPGRLQSMGSQRVGYHWATSLSLSHARSYTRY